ncbi:hypothetical protein Q9Q99_03105 [Curtobacterium flaccumfaciens]|nr:hypothetical protein Q9Q99_03105 [Curtobacterium flaccumfaciens]
MTDPLSALAAAVTALPEDRALRLRYAELLADAGRHGEAIEQAGTVLQQAPDDEQAAGIVRASALAAAASPVVGQESPGEDGSGEDGGGEDGSGEPTAAPGDADARRRDRLVGAGAVDRRPDRSAVPRSGR